jgi:Trk K+ transport system NAD-binding subunit
MNLVWKRPVRRFHRLRNFQATVRDTLVLINEFKFTLLAFSVIVLSAGWLYYQLSLFAGDTSYSYPESIFIILAMIFLQANIAFPDEWYRQIFFFVMPIVGLALITRGADFALLLFNRRLRKGEWQVAVATTYSDHVVLIGLGHLGFRVARELRHLGDEVIVIEQDPKAELLAQAQELGLLVIEGEASKIETLKAANIEQASAIILCTSNDSINLQIGIKAHNLNPKAKVMVRVFDEDFAQEIQQHFGFGQAFSASALAAPAIAGAANESDVSSPISLAGRTLSLARFVIKKHSTLIGMTIDQVENNFDATIVLLERGKQADLHPHNDLALVEGDHFAIFGEPKALNKISKANR